MGAENLTGAHFVFDFVFFEEVADAIFEFVGDGAGAADDFREIDAEIGEGNAVGFGLGAHFEDECAVFEEGFGGDASPVEAGAAEILFFDAEDAAFDSVPCDPGGVFDLGDFQFVRAAGAIPA